MLEVEQLRVAVCGVDLKKELTDLAEEYAFHWKELSSDKTKFRVETKRFKPDVVISNNETIPTIYALTNESDRPFLVVISEEHTGDLPNTLSAGVADDVLVLPFRHLSFINTLRWAKSMRSIRKLEGMSANVEQMVDRLHQDFALAQKIQRRLIKDRFPNIPGLSIKSKYWCGLRGGGDYFDVFEFGDDQHVGFLLGDVSSYALSSRFLSSLMMFSVKNNFEEALDPSAFVRKVYLGLAEIMKDNDHFSCFYGVIDKRSYTIRFVSYGTVAASIHSSRKNLKWLSKGKNSALTRLNSKIKDSDVIEIILEPQDRLSLFSDGFVEGAGMDLDEFYEKIDDKDSQKVLNEFSYALKNYQDPGGEAIISGETKLPPQDCSILLVEVAKNILRLAQ